MHFLEMRTKLGTGEGGGTASRSSGTKSSVTKMAEPEIITMQTIIDEKPPKAKVLEYFKKRIEELEDD
jgi:hypothetical protein